MHVTHFVVGIDFRFVCVRLFYCLCVVAEQNELFSFQWDCSDALFEGSTATVGNGDMCPRRMGDSEIGGVGGGGGVRGTAGRVSVTF